MNNVVEYRIGNNPRICAAVRSALGTRSYQQDFVVLLTGKEGLMAAVCDGMGGLKGGERASRTAAMLLCDDYRGQRPADIPRFLRAEAAKMDERVAALTGEDGGPLKGGTTVVSVVIQGSTLYWLSVGDSRIYLLRGERMQAVTRDHNYRTRLNEALRAGRITRQEYEREEKTPKAEALVSFIGMKRLEMADVGKLPVALAPGDIVLLCSDGLYKSLDESQILAMIKDNEVDMQIAADRLVDMALSFRQGGHDNTSVVLVKYEGDQGGNAG